MEVRSLNMMHTFAPDLSASGMRIHVLRDAVGWDMDADVDPETFEYVLRSLQLRGEIHVAGEGQFDSWVNASPYFTVNKLLNKYTNEFTSMVSSWLI